jgi:predicted ArsR family transcriptional regulator
MDTAGAKLSPTQRRVLATIKRREEATADELAEVLAISASAVRQHLSALRSAGFVEARQDRGHTGRPADRYHATAASEPLFAAGSDLTTELLGYIEEEDPELVSRIFTRRRHRLVEAAQDLSIGSASTRERVAALTSLLDGQGYLADFDELADGRYRISLHSCPIWAVAQRHRQACDSELGAIRDLLPDAMVDRITHKAAGSYACAYEIRDPSG